MAINKNSKKVQVDRGKTVIFAMVSLAAIVVVASLMISKGIWSQASYVGRVADKKEKAVKQLEDNKAAIDSLKEAYEKFTSENPNLIGGDAKGTTERDGTNDVLVLDALPGKYDFPAVASSLEKMLFGYTINAVSGAAQIPGVTDVATSDASLQGGVTEIPFAFEVSTNYDGFKQLINLFNRSIRPFHFTKVELNGTNAELDVSVEGKTFYQLERGLVIKSEVVK